MINLQNQISLNKFLLPFHALYYSIGVARALIHVTHQVFLRTLGQCIYSPDQYKLNLKKNKYNLQLILCDYHKWKCRFLFRDFFVTPISNIPKNYDDYVAANRQKEKLIKEVQENIEKDTRVSLRSGGFNHLAKRDKGCCMSLTEYLAYCLIKDPLLFFSKIEENKNGVSSEIAARQYAYEWFSRDWTSISRESLSRVISKVKSKAEGRIGGFNESQTKLDDLVADSKTYKISFEAYRVGIPHQILMHNSPTYTMIVDPNIGLLFCKSARKMELLTKVIESYDFNYPAKREIRVDSLKLFENHANYIWDLNTKGFQTYEFQKKIKSKII